MRLEPQMWDAIETIARLEGMTINRLCAEIDQRRREIGLTSATRVFIISYYRQLVRSYEGQGPGPSGSLARPEPSGSLARPEPSGSLARPEPSGSLARPEPSGSLARVVLDTVVGQPINRATSLRSAGYRNRNLAVTGED